MVLVSSKSIHALQRYRILNVIRFECKPQYYLYEILCLSVLLQQIEMKQPPLESSMYALSIGKVVESFAGFQLFGWHTYY